MSDRIIVYIQIVLILLVLLPVPDFWPPRWAIFVFVLAEAILLWVILNNKFGNWSIYPKPKTDAQLIRSGPYRYVRNPMYLGLLLLLLSFVLWDPSTVRIGALLMLCIVLIVKIKREEHYLSMAFDDWTEYQNACRYRLVPLIW